MKEVFALSLMVVIVFLALAERERSRRLNEAEPATTAAVAVVPETAETAETDAAEQAPSVAHEKQTTVQAPKPEPAFDFGPIGAVEGPLTNALVTTTDREVRLPMGTVTLNAGVAVTLLQDRGPEVDVLWQNSMIALPRAAVRNANAPVMAAAPLAAVGPAIAAQTTPFAMPAGVGYEPAAGYEPAEPLGSSTRLRMSSLNDNGGRAYRTSYYRYDPYYYYGYYPSTTTYVRAWPMEVRTSTGTAVVWMARDAMGNIVQVSRTDVPVNRTTSSSASPIRISNAAPVRASVVSRPASDTCSSGGTTSSAFQNRPSTTSSAGSVTTRAVPAAPRTSSSVTVRSAPTVPTRVTSH